MRNDVHNGDQGRVETLESIRNRGRNFGFVQTYQDEDHDIILNLVILDRPQLQPSRNAGRKLSVLPRLFGEGYRLTIYIL